VHAAMPILMDALWILGSFSISGLLFLNTLDAI
jgi:hypothetical protein